MKIGLVLSSGGPKGIAHLGVLKRLEEEGIKPDVISGSSAGAIIGGLYASGMSVDEMIDLALSRTLNDIFSDYTIFGIYNNGFGALKGNRLLKTLREKTLNKKFKDLKIPFAVNAVDSLTSKEVVLKNGGIAEALRASASIPLLFKPFYLNGQYLIDGSVSNPLPSKIAKNLGADHTIGISFANNKSLTELNDNITLSELTKAIASKLDHKAFSTLKRVLNIPFIDKALNLLSLDRIMLKHYIQMHNNSSKNNLNDNSVDNLIETDLSTYKTTEDLINLGYISAGKVIDNINEDIHNKREWHGIN